MNTKNIKTGIEVKNYSELCKLLGEKVKGGKSKILHIQEIERYLKLEKVEGANKIKIVEVYETPLPKEDDRTVYRQHIQFIILDYIAKNGCAELTKNQILDLCGMVNRKYLDKEYREKISKHGMDKFNVNDFFRRTNAKFDKIIKSAIMGLSGIDKCYAVVKNSYKIVQDNKEWIADLEEELIIEYSKNMIYEKMNLSGMQEVHRRFLTIEFYKKLNKLLENEYGWERCYTVYQIIPTVKIEENIKHFIKKNSEIRLEKKILNSKVEDYFNKEAEKIYSKNMNLIESAEEFKNEIFEEYLFCDDNLSLEEIYENSNSYKKSLSTFKLYENYVEYQQRLCVDLIIII